MRVLSTVAMLFAGALASAANPLNYTEYVQNVDISFRTPEEAQQAQLVPLPLPEGKILAISSRWDDTNPRHLRMAELLKKHGWKGTFYLFRLNDTFNRQVLPALTTGGHSIGNHTISHPRLPQLLPNVVWQEIHLNRMLLESASGTAVNTFVLPFCDRSNGFDRSAAAAIGNALRRSGEIGSPEFFATLEKEYGYPAGTFSNSYLFCPDDRKPDPALFDRRVAEGIKRIADPNSQLGPHLTLGLHTWQDDAGFETLGKCLEKYGNNPDWWYCNENEYAAYRYEFHHAAIAKKGVDGTTAHFEITRIAPRALGAETPLWVEVAPAPLDGKTRFALPKAPAALGLPAKIDLLRNLGNRPAADSAMTAKHFPLTIGFSADRQKKTVIYRLTNNGKTMLERPVVTFRLPPGQLRGTIRRELAVVESGKTLQLELPLGDETGQSVDQPGPLLWSAQLDFAIDGKPGRVYSTAEIDPPYQPTASPRDTVLVLGPLPKEEFTESWCAAVSVPGRTPASLEETLHGRWFPTEPDKRLRPGLVRIRANDKEWKSSADKLLAKADPALRVAALVEFNAPEAGSYRLFLLRNGVEALYLNGKKLAFEKDLPRRIELPAGRSRILLVSSFRKPPDDSRYFSVGAGDAPDDHLAFVVPSGE